LIEDRSKCDSMDKFIQNKYEGLKSKKKYLLKLSS